MKAKAILAIIAVMSILLFGCTKIIEPGDNIDSQTNGAESDEQGIASQTGNNPSNTIPTDVGIKTVRLNLSIEKFGGFNWVRENSEKDVTYVLIDVREGEEFGPTDCIGCKTMPFNLVEIIDNAAKVKFSNNFVVSGEPISKESMQNPIVISKAGVCFTSRTTDSGTEIC